jgi:hypothetical protein
LYDRIDDEECQYWSHFAHFFMVDISSG